MRKPEVPRRLDSSLLLGSAISQPRGPHLGPGGCCPEQPGPWHLGEGATGRGLAGRYHLLGCLQSTGQSWGHLAAAAPRSTGCAGRWKGGTRAVPTASRGAEVSAAAPPFRLRGTAALDSGDVSQGRGGWPGRPSRSRLPEEPVSQSVSQGSWKLARFQRSGRQLGQVLEVPPASSTAQSRVSSTVSAHTYPFLGAASGGSLLSWAWPGSGSAGEERLALRGGGSVPIHQELYGDLEGPTSRSNGAESGTDMLFPPSHPVPPGQATVSSCSPSLEALGTAASPFPLALRWPGGAHFPLFLRAFAQAESGPPLPCRCLTPFFSCQRFKRHLWGLSLSFHTKTAPSVTPGRFSPQCPVPPSAVGATTSSPGWELPGHSVLAPC